MHLADQEFDDPALVRMRWYGQVGILFVMLIIAVPHLRSEQYFSFIDYVNLGFHEAGHFILGILGNQFLTALGGTLGQLFVPAAFLVYFIYKKEYRGALFTAFWFFENFLNISIYMADAQYQRLQLIGGDGSVHDWVYLFAEMKCITKSTAFAHGLRVIGTLGMLAAMFGTVFMLMVKNPFTGASSGTGGSAGS